MNVMTVNDKLGRRHIRYWENTLV